MFGNKQPHTRHLEPVAHEGKIIAFQNIKSGDLYSPQFRQSLLSKERTRRNNRLVMLYSGIAGVVLAQSLIHGGETPPVAGAPSVSDAAHTTKSHHKHHSQSTAQTSESPSPDVTFGTSQAPSETPVYPSPQTEIATVAPLPSETLPPPTPPSETSAPEDTSSPFGVVAATSNVYVVTPRDEAIENIKTIAADTPELDFMLLQEAYRLSNADLTIGKFGVVRDTFNRDVMETPILYDKNKWQPIKSDSLLLHDQPVKGGRRYANYAVFKNIEDSPDQNKMVSVIDVHEIQSSEGPAREAILKEGVEALAELDKQLVQYGPRIYGGDWNRQIENDLPYPLSLLEKSKLQSTYELHPVPPSWHSGEHGGSATLDGFIVPAGSQIAWQKMGPDTPRADHIPIVIKAEF